MKNGRSVSLDLLLPISRLVRIEDGFARKVPIERVEVDAFSSLEAIPVLVASPAPPPSGGTPC